MMSEKEQQQSIHTMDPPANVYTPNETEAAAAAAHDGTREREQRKKKRTKWLLYIVLFAIFHAAVIAVLAVTVLKVRTPRFRIRSATLHNFNLDTTINPSLSARMNAEFSIRNANFGRYRYQNGVVRFLYHGTPVGEVIIRNARVHWRSSRRFNVALDLDFANAARVNNSQFARDMGSGVVPIRSESRLRGRVDLLFFMRRNRASNMNCSMEIITATQQLRNIVCK
ncbi:hypothetical protein ACJIZ3_009039 [Penstemon smallii]|uniref:Late embryogenesis abundant protein LEA-2 subgroup domain-containing protein n=1 Tax=Penstemon smallii TaxID=265156 RepID=A0ABD3TDN5_9LAMI